MKTKLLKLALCAVGLITSVVSTSAQSWDFEKTAFTATELANIIADETGYTQTTENTRYTYKLAIDNASLNAQSTELDFTNGLKFIAKENGIRLYSNYALELLRQAINSDATKNANASYVIIPNVPKDATVTIKFKSNNTNTVQIVSDELTDISSPITTTSDVTYTGTVKATGDVKIGYKVQAASAVCQIRSISTNLGMSYSTTKSWDFTSLTLPYADGTAKTPGDLWCTSGSDRANAYGLNDVELTQYADADAKTAGTATKYEPTKGLFFTGTNNSGLSIIITTTGIKLNRTGVTIKIKNLKKGQKIKVVAKPAANDRYIDVITNLTALSSWKKVTTSDETLEAIVNADGDVVFGTTEKSNVTIKSINISDPTSYKVGIQNIEWASLYLPFNAAIPDGVTAYYAKTVNSTTVSLKKIENGIPANQGVVVKGSEGIYEFVSTSTVDEITSNLFDGVTSDKAFDDSEIYVLAGSDNEKAKPIFKLYDSGSSSGVTLSAYKSYLLASNVSGLARTLQFGFDDDETTGISDVRINTENGTTQYYDLSGRRVTQPTKGLYIVNGKKVIIK